MASYKPLGGYSPSLQPSVDQPDLNPNEQYDLEEQSTRSMRAPSPQPESRQYNNYRYTNVPDDFEGEGLIKEQPPPQYRLYKRRFFGLAELTILSFAIGWGFTAPSIVAQTAIKWYDITFPELNYLSIAGSLVFLVPAPFVIWILNRSGPKMGIVIACVFLVVGNWVIYAGAKTHNFSVNIAGTIIHSLASPFAICAPTRYSRQWFGDSGRTLSTAIASLAYPLGAGFGALTGPFMVKPVGPFEYDMQALIIAIVFTAVAIPAPFLPNRPPTPPSFVSAGKELTFKESAMSLLRNKVFYLQFVSFSILAGTIDTALSLTNQALAPYGYNQQVAGYAVAFLIFVGIGAALLVSPILDKTKKHEPALKVFVTIIAICYTALPWVPESHSTAALYVVFAIIGAASLSVEPCVLEYQASRTYPVSPEFSSVICWSGARITSAVFTIIAGNVLLIKRPEEGQPKGSLFNGLLFIAGMAWLAALCTYFSGVWIFKRTAESKVKGND